jgi:hypothetical protein
MEPFSDLHSGRGTLKIGERRCGAAREGGKTGIKSKSLILVIGKVENEPRLRTAGVTLGHLSGTIESLILPQDADFNQVLVIVQTRYRVSSKLL